jgi:hypothetical protein
MDRATSLEILGCAERAALITLTLHEQLIVKGHPDLARLAWVVYVGASASAEKIGQMLGVEVLTG